MLKVYHLLNDLFLNLLLSLHKIKLRMGHFITFNKNKKLIKSVRWDSNKNQEFIHFWKNNYGKIVKSKSHKYFESINGVFQKDYFPEDLFSNKLELKINNFEYAKVFSNKALLESLFSFNKDIVFPKTILLNANGLWYNGNRDIVKKALVQEVLYNKKDIIIKPILEGREGRGILFPNFIDGKDKNEEITLKEVLESKNIIIQEVVKQEDSYKKLHPSSLNTIRLTTYIAKDALHCMNLCLRIGTGKTKVDNLGRGGIVIGLSNDGYLNKFAYVLGNSKEKYSKHPDTNIVFENYKVPKTKEMIKIAKKLHASVINIGIISWDFAVNEKEEVVLIEANFLGSSIRYPQITHGKPAFGENTIYMLEKIKK